MRIGPLGVWELLIILVVVLLIFGPRRLPEMAKGLGQSVREFRKGIRDIRNDFEEGDKGGDAAKPQQAAAPPPSATPPASAAPAANTAAASEPSSAAPEASPPAPASEADAKRDKLASDA